MSNLTLLKAIWQIRFPSAASLFDCRGEIAEYWQEPKGDLSDWRIESNRVAVTDKQKLTLLQADYKSVSVVMEFPESYDTFAQIAAEFSIYILDRLRIQTVDRIGLRLIRVAEQSNFHQMVRRFSTNIYRLADEDWDILGGRPYDVGLHLVMDYDDSKRMNISVGPMQQEQLSVHFESEDARGRLPEELFFTDIDLYDPEPRLKLNSRDKTIRRYLNEDGLRVMEMIDEFIDRYGGLNVGTA